MLNTNSALEDLPKLTNCGEYGPLAEEAGEARRRPQPQEPQVFFFEREQLRRLACRERGRRAGRTKIPSVRPMSFVVSYTSFWNQTWSQQGRV